MVAELTAIVGEEFTLTVAIAIFEHPAVVPVTVYVELLIGETVIELELEPESQL